MDGESPLFLSGNRGKRSAVLDLETEAGRASLRRLVAGCDVFAQAFRAGVIERLGFGYDSVRSLRPGVISSPSPRSAQRGRHGSSRATTL